MVRVAKSTKPKPTFEEKIQVPGVRPIQNWVVVGIDPSLTRTGLALMNNTYEADPEWLAIKSLKPDKTKTPSWIRSMIMSDFIADSILGQVSGDGNQGLIIVLEAPTMGNDYLNTINKVIHAKVMPSVFGQFENVCIMHVNAMTMRSCLGLTATGNNKHENIRKSHEYANPVIYPGIDSDACDAVLLAQFGRCASDIFMGKEVSTLPERVTLALCDFTDVAKGKGRNARVEKKGIMHNPVYWFDYHLPTVYSVSIKDARIPPKKRLEKFEISI